MKRIVTIRNASLTAVLLMFGTSGLFAGPRNLGPLSGKPGQTGQIQKSGPIQQSNFKSQLTHGKLNGIQFAPRNPGLNSTPIIKIPGGTLGQPKFPGKFPGNVGPIVDTGTPKFPPKFPGGVGPILDPKKPPIFDPKLPPKFPGGVGPILDPIKPPKFPPKFPGGPIVDPNPGGGGNGGPGNGGGNGGGNGNGGGGGGGGGKGNSHHHHWCWGWGNGWGWNPPCWTPWPGCYGDFHCPVIQPYPLVVTEVVPVVETVFVPGTVDLSITSVLVVQKPSPNLGMLLRVTVTNKGSVDLAANARLGLFASHPGQTMGEMPRAVQLLEPLVSGQTTEIAIRLPVEANSRSLLLIAVEMPEGYRDANEQDNVAQGEIARLPGMEVE
jgi:hypothetical protein